MAWLYMAVTYLRSYATDKGAEFVLAGLSSVEGKVTLTLDMDVPFFHNIDQAQDVGLCMAHSR